MCLTYEVYRNHIYNTGKLGRSDHVKYLAITLLLLCRWIGIDLRYLVSLRAFL